MLARYSIERGRKLSDYPKALREGTRQDTRKHTRHVLRPDAARVAAYLDDPSDGAWASFAKAYRAQLEQRHGAERAAFDELAALATAGDVYIGCSCPTVRNPDVERCHTVLRY